jgi:hypothetical protein
MSVEGALARPLKRARGALRGKPRGALAAKPGEADVGRENTPPSARHRLAKA